MNKKKDKTKGAGTRLPVSKTKKSRLPKAYKKRQRSASIFFLLMTVLSLLAVVIIGVFSISQHIQTSHAYKEAVSHDLTERGQRLQQQVLKEPPDYFGGSYSAYLRYLAQENKVAIHIIDENGQLLFPRENNFDPNAPEMEEYYDFSKPLAKIKDKLSSEDNFAVYEYIGNYVYAAEIQLYGTTTAYLSIEKSLDVLSTATRRVIIRTVTIAAVVLIVTLAVSAALSAWLIKPIDQMKKKAQKLAEGDFSVDFHGADYGKEMVELADALNFARDELSKTDAMQKDLIANVSHDFKTPLTMIKAYASMIMEISGEVPEKRNKHAQVIVDEADRLTSLVNDVLDLSKIQSGIRALQFKTVDVSAYLEELVSRFDYLSGYHFVLDIEEGLTTQADEVAIGQALYNLIGNAVNYTGEDNTVYVRLKQDSASTFRFEVKDTGKGIKPEEKEKIWQRYYRSSEAHKRPVQGTGLGLSIVQSILQKHGFTFGVESEEGKGSTFYVVFPLTNA